MSWGKSPIQKWSVFQFSTLHLYSVIIFWLHINGQGSEDEGDMISNSSSLYEIHTEPFNEDFNTQESTITIKSAKIESSGKYICKWETDDLNVSATMELAVRSTLFS